MSRLRYEDSATSRQDLLLCDYINLAVKRFKWSNLPIGLNSDKLEEMLITHGLLSATRIDGMSEIVILPSFGEGAVNIYNENVNFRLMGFNGQNYSRKLDDIVLLRNNPTRTEDISTLQLYAKRIDDIEQTQEVNLFQQNIPKMLSVPKEGKLTAKNIIQQIKDFKFVILTRDKGIQSQMKKEDIIDNTAPFLLDKLSDYENFYRNKVLTFLGLNNSNTDKKERLVVDEVNSNNEYITSILDMYYECRQEFCNEVNEKFGTNIQVEKREVEEIESVHVDDKTAGGE